MTRLNLELLMLHVIFSIVIRPSQLYVSFPIARPTHFFGKVKKKMQNHFKKSKYFSLQAHDLVLLTPIGLNYYRYFVFVAFLDIWQSCSCYTIWLRTKGPRYPFVLSSPAFTGTQNINRSFRPKSFRPNLKVVSPQLKVVSPQLKVV